MIDQRVIALLLPLFILIAAQEKLIEQQKLVTVRNYTGPMTKEILDSLKDVSILEIKHSRITHYPSHVFSYLPKLEKVVVESSHFDIIDHNIYKNANNLREIYFAKNEVPDLPLDLLRYTTFEKIIIADQGQVKAIPENFANETKRLKHFECKRCKIERIEKGAFNNLDKLENLDLHENSLQELPKSILSPLKNLKKLNLQDNQIGVFNTDALDGLKSLENIDLSGNPLKKIDLIDAAKVAPNLKIVDLRRTDVPKSQIDENAEKTNILFLHDKDD